MAVTDIHERRTAATTKELIDRGLTASGYVLDVADRAGVGHIVEQIEKELGPVDILVNSAVNPIGAVHEVAGDDWDHTLAVDLTAPSTASGRPCPG